MQGLFTRAVFFCLFLVSTAGFSAETAERVLAAHLHDQTIGLPGKASFSFKLPDLSRLPECSSLQAFTPAGAKSMGRTTVGLRCLAPSSWSVLVPVQISVIAAYVVTARPLLAGQLIGPDDVATVNGDVAALPVSVLGNVEAAVGKTLRNSLAAGLPLRAEQLAAPLVIRQGQAVRVVGRGEGFAVSSEGKAIANAAEGQVVQVRLGSGQLVSGIARADGSVEIAF